MPFLEASSETMPRPEYPRPQFVRPDWQCLNGSWQFEIDGGDSGEERGLLTRPLSDAITVPFCPESELSGLAYTDFMLAVWYKKEITVPDAWQGRSCAAAFRRGRLRRDRVGQRHGADASPGRLHAVFRAAQRRHRRGHVYGLPAGAR